MDRTFLTLQLIACTLMFLCVIAGGTANIIHGTISGIMGYATVAFFALLTAKLVQLSWREWNAPK